MVLLSTPAWFEFGQNSSDRRDSGQLQQERDELALLVEFRSTRKALPLEFVCNKKWTKMRGHF